MGWITTRRTTGLIIAAATAALILFVIIDGGSARARSARQLSTQPLLSLPRGGFEVSLGTPPLTLPLANTPQTLTLIAGPPKVRRAASQNVYVGFTSATRSCAATPATSKATFTVLPHLYTAAHGAARHAGVFAPNGGAAKGSYIASQAGVVVRGSGSVHVCIWVSTTTGPNRVVKRHHHRRKVVKARRSLAATLTVALENTTFAASVSNLGGSTAGRGGYDMYAIDGGRAFRYSASTTLCGSTSTDRAATVAAGTPGSESVAIAAAPCTGDSSTFSFRGAGVAGALAYPVADALSTPPTAVGLGGCELDPLTGVTLATAAAYLQSVGCSLARIEITPYRRTLTRGVVAWASVDGGVAELAPAGSHVDLVLNGLPPTQPARRSR